MSDFTPPLVIASVWLAVFCIPAGLLLRLDSDRWQLWQTVWTVGAFSFLVHTVSAYGLVYGWSQSVALEETRRQTAAATGFDSGVGLYFNLLFAALWTVDAARSWSTPERVRGQITLGALATHTFLTFMLVNGAFVFVAGPRRWVGLAFSILVMFLLSVAVHRHRSRERAVR